MTSPKKAAQKENDNFDAMIREVAKYIAEQLGADAHVCTNPSCLLYTDLSQVAPKLRVAPAEYVTA